jgi:hypothetical protein
LTPPPGGKAVSNHCPEERIQPGGARRALVGHEAAELALELGSVMLAPPKSRWVCCNVRYRFDDPHAPPGQLRPLHRPDTDQDHSRPSSPIGVSGD